MNLSEYARHDALGIADLIARGEVSPREVAGTAMRAIEAVNGPVNAVIETYGDRIDDLDEAALGDGPFRGVPFLIKDVFGHEEGRLCEFGSRLCQGMKTAETTNFGHMFRAAGLNIMGRTNAPEYSMAGATENALYGKTSTPWREGYCAGGSSGGAAAAVMSGMVPIAHGTDIAGSIRIPASWCGSVGLKTSRGRSSFGPILDEGGFGLSIGFAQTRSIRDTAGLLDCMKTPFPGDPFHIPTPERPYGELAREAARRQRIGMSFKPLMGIAVDAEVEAAVRAAAQVLADQGHEIVEIDPDFDGLTAVRNFCNIWFFALDKRLEGYAAITGRTVGPDTLEPVIHALYEHARTLEPADLMSAMGAVNHWRRRLAQVYEDCDIWLGPTNARVSEPHGRYNLGREGIGFEAYVDELLAVPAQFTVPHNILGTPALSLPLALHSSGLPIGVQLGAPHAREDVLLQLGAVLEQAMPWRDRVPELHVSRA